LIQELEKNDADIESAKTPLTESEDEEKKDWQKEEVRKYRAREAERQAILAKHHNSMNAFHKEQQRNKDRGDDGAEESEESTPSDNDEGEREVNTKNRNLDSNTAEEKWPARPDWECMPVDELDRELK
jgi:hypothetical protein